MGRLTCVAVVGILLLAFLSNRAPLQRLCRRTDPAATPSRPGALLAAPVVLSLPAPASTLAPSPSERTFACEVPVRRTVARVAKFEQGALRQTGKQLDWAIAGEGFFRVTMEDGTTAYTRDGEFHRDANGNITTLHGLRLDPALQIPATVTCVSITSRGFIQGFDPQQPEQSVHIGQLTVSRFVNPQGLQPIGDHLFLATEEAGQNAQPVEEGDPGSGGLGWIQDRCLESLDAQGVPCAPSSSGCPTGRAAQDAVR